MPNSKDTLNVKNADGFTTTVRKTLTMVGIGWMSKLYALQAETEGVLGVIATGAMVVDMVYFNIVERAPYWYTQLDLKMVVKVRHVLWSGLQLDEISATNKLPLTCNRLDVRQKRVGKIATQEHDMIMEEAGKHDRLECSEDKDSNDIDKLESKVESDSNDK